jgi:hypothetical protein
MWHESCCVMGTGGVRWWHALKHFGAGKVRKYFKSIFAVAGLGMLATWSFNANAVTCGDFQLEAAVQCELGNDNNDPYPSNLEAFGVSWTAIDKDDAAGVVDGNDPDTGELESIFQWTAGPDQDPADALAGEWFLDDAIWSTYDRLVIVLKAGPTFASFELVFGDLSGDWFTQQGLSHASLYGIVGDTTVPEPGTLGLLGLGLLGIGLARRRAR